MSSLRPRVLPIAENRYGRPIAFQFQYIFELVGSRGHPLYSGRVIWLPPTTEIFDSEAIELLLKEKYEVFREESPPHWIDQYLLPDEAPIRERIEHIQDRIAQLSDELKQAEEGLKVATRFKRLLYETGEAVLEPVVLDALRELGATIEQPRERGKEDGRLVDPTGRAATLEIKGRSGTLKIGDVRQLHQWVADSIAYEGRESKGILIANLNKDRPPSRRGEVFPSNCVRVARNFDINLVTTTQVFNALVLHQQSKLDVDLFWNSLLEGKGICKFQELE